MLTASHDSGTPADWLSPDSRFSSGRWVAGSKHHQRVEAAELELGLRVRCHDCGLIARHNYRKAVLDTDGAVVVPEQDPVPWALDRLDLDACLPSAPPPKAGAQLALFGTEAWA